MANYNVDIAVAVKNLTSLDKLKSELKEIDDAYKKLGVGDKLQLKERAALIKREIGLEEEKTKKIERRTRLEEKAADARSARIAREASLAARARSGELEVTDPAGPDVRLRSYAEAQQKAVKAESDLRNEINKGNMALDLRRQQTERIGKQRRQNMNMVDREIDFEKRLNDIFRKRGLLTEQQMKKEERMRKKRINAAVTGGAFPLLFGGGPLQALGGAIGGGISGEMFSGATVGLQVLGSTVDRIIGGLISSANELALATTETDANIETILNSLGRVGDASLEYIRNLDTTETKVFALKEANEQLARVVGTEGVENLQKFGDQSRRLQNELTSFFTSLSASVAGLIAQEGRLDEITKMFEEMRLLDAAKRSAQSDPEMALLFAQRKTATGQDRLKLADQILDRQRQIEESADNELEIKRQQLAVFLEDQRLREQALVDQEAAEAAAGRELANRLNAGDDIIETLNRQLRVAQARTDQERLTARQQNQQEQALDKIHESQEDIVRGLLSELFAQQNINFALEERKKIMEKLRKFAETRTPAERTRDDLNREVELLGAKLQGQEKAFTLARDIADADRKGVEGAENLLTLRQQLKDQLTSQDIKKEQEDRIGQLQAQINGTEEQFELQQKIQEILDKKLGTGEAELIQNEIKIASLEEEAKLIEQQRQLYEQVGATIQSGIVNGIMSALDGSKSLSESLSGLLKQVGGMFLNVGIGALGQSMGIPGFKPFAQGGYVSGPTTALVGEGGQGEYVIPENKMRESMARYSRGARGSAVVPEAGASGTSGEGGGTAVAAPIDVRFNVERINNVDYVTAEQFQVGLARAAQQGAAEGERRAMGSLRNSAAVRRRIGV